MKVKVGYTVYKEVTIDAFEGSKLEKWSKIHYKDADERTDEDWEFLADYDLIDVIMPYIGEQKEDIFSAIFID